MRYNVEEPKETTKNAKEESAVEDEVEQTEKDSTYVYNDAIRMCQILKDALYNPDSLQIHKVYHIEQYGTDYYLDYSAMNQMGGYTRGEYYAQFENSTIYYMVDEENSQYQVAYDIISGKFEELPYEKLDVDLIAVHLN
ncbi:MAG: hypothetical protein IKJ63_02725 [Clostridia bacterium]|nr:hypothetical protein [Clostridia bacterium]